LDFREKAPLAADPEMYVGPDGRVIDALSTRGYLAVAVPGTVSGLETALAKYGTMKRSRLIAPAIGFAERGFVLEQGDTDLLRKASEDFRKDQAAAAIFLDHGEPYAPGKRLVQTQLARTLRRISSEGVKGFYHGPVGAAIVSAVQAGKGIITQSDLDQYETRERKPVECDYRGYHVVSAPPPSSGGVIVCEILNVLEGYPLKDLGRGSAQAVHYEIEAMRHAYVDRNSYLGDPDYVRNPVEHLLDKAYAARIRAVIDPAKAGVSAEIGPAMAPHEGSDTTHYSIVDRFGNAVSVTYTLNGAFGARVVAAGTGVLLNNEMDDFTVKEGVPNLYALVQGTANAIAPGKRPLSSMSPTIISRDGKLVMVVGTPGGSRIISAVVEVILNVIDYGMNIQEAVDAPRLHQQWWPDSTFVENFALSPDTQKILLAMGHKLIRSRPANHVAAILVGAPSLDATAVGANRYYGANDPRGNTGLALGY